MIKSEVFMAAELLRASKRFASDRPTEFNQSQLRLAQERHALARRQAITIVASQEHHRA
jgi:hypothetical protein